MGTRVRSPTLQDVQKQELGTAETHMINAQDGREGVMRSTLLPLKMVACTTGVGMFGRTTMNTAQLGLRALVLLPHTQPLLVTGLFLLGSTLQSDQGGFY